MTIFSKRSLLRLAVTGAVAVGAPLAVAGTANAAPDSAWDRLAQCESGGRWNINTGNGYSGGLQFNPTTWRAFGGTGSAHNASREQQIAVAERVLAAQGWGAWPACSSKMGLRGHEASPGRTVRASKPAAPKPAPRTTTSAPAAPAQGGNGQSYTVRSGDTLSKIAAANSTSWQKLQGLNGLGNPHLINVGQVLKLG
ncbi:transglycosylase family protein [Pseudonocardia bannensis]|uniref:LysM peptidoglycan-binding domain-containing protein n=1 Tax=Pseudonocardia bannensis TaxID=630973 RepID=A0A848DPV7_9PSEU|nr:transglycosylase family protein [Pseudonocardia bannensis]NMH94822.1 LysM peptidoglycan-binding domain-containing protein [Pseudonocardia bannensis]